MTDPPAAVAPAPARWPRRLAVLSWVGWLSAAFSLWAQYQLGVYDTVGWLWLLPAVAGAVATHAGERPGGQQLPHL